MRNGSHRSSRTCPNGSITRRLISQSPRVSTLSVISSSTALLKHLVAIMSFIVLACSIFPDVCRCHQMTVAAPAAASHACCKATDVAEKAALCSGGDCCCKKKQALEEALSINSRSEQESSWQQSPNLIVVILTVTQSFIDQQSHFIQKVASTYASTGPPLYLLHRALLL